MWRTLGTLVVALCLTFVNGESCFKPSVSPPGANDQSQFSENKLEFTLDMFHKLYQTRGELGQNLFFSPHSIHQALMMAFFGSKGDTETELRSALKLGAVEKHSKESLIQQYKMDNFYRETGCGPNNGSGGADLRVANKIYFNEEEPVRECVREIFESEISLLNLSNETEISRKKINDWVASNTNDKIKDLIPQIKEHTRMIIVNSAYFKGTWEQQFKKSNTKPRNFYVSGSEVTQTMMMSQKGSFRHGVSESLKSYILELPYEGESMSMFILLPPFTPNALAETISRLNASTLRSAMDEMTGTDSLEVQLPRFKVQQTFELSQTLSSLGISSLFNQSASDLSDFSPKSGLSVDEALHKSYLEVNEEGATAAAATALIGARIGRPLDQTRFICNHPFVFFIYDNCAKNVVFIGAFHKPTKH